MPPLHPLAQRAMEMRNRLVRLGRLKIGTGILEIYQATKFDLELMALAEDELNRKEQPDNGDGSAMDSDCEG